MTRSSLAPTSKRPSISSPMQTLRKSGEGGLQALTGASETHPVSLASRPSMNETAPGKTPSPGGPVVVHVFGRTDVGRTREHNEDAFVVADLSTDNATLQPEVRTHTGGSTRSLFMVADGMGGAAAG